MSQSDEHDPPPGGGTHVPVVPTRTGGWTPARTPPPAADRSAGPAQWAPQLPTPAPPPPVAAPPARSVAAPEPVLAPEPVVTESVPPVVDAETDDDPDRLRADELPWGVPARALVGAGAALPPPTVVSRRRAGSTVRLVALVAIVAAIVVLVIIAVTR